MTAADILPDAAGWSAPSPRLRHVRRVETGTVGAAVLAIVVAIEAVSSASIDVVVASIAVVVVAVVGASALLVRRAASYGYVERDDDLLLRRGVLVRRLSVVPYGRMQFVDVTAGPFERAFGLSTVRLHTAAAATDARIPGLAGTEAARLRDRLTVLGEAGAAGL